jgi:DNA-3-methyladenine glycosylase
MGRIIQPAEVHHRGTVSLARWLIGKALVRERGGRRQALLITETEAYHTARDRACHASKGRTPRTEVLFGKGGVWYVYLCYGMHEMLNLVTGPEGFPAAVLIRGVQGINGPGRLTKALGIGRKLNRRVIEPRCGLHLEEHGVIVRPRDVRATPRIGIGYAGAPWVGKKWRFEWSPSVGEL